MTDFLVTFLASMLREQGIPNPGPIAEKAAATLRKAHIVDEDGLKRAQIKSDPSRDRHDVMERHGVSVATVYKAWKGR